MKRLLLALIGGCILGAPAIPQTRPLSAEEARWNEPVAPFRIAGPIYYVGTRDIASYLFVDEAGMILLDGGFEASARLILSNIRKLGVEPRQIRILLNSQAHADHAGGLAAIRAATGARLLASPADARLLRAGGRGDPQFGDAMTYPAVQVDGTVRDGQIVRVGKLRLTAHLTPGHSPGCTTWSATVDVGGSPRSALFVCGASAPGFKLIGNPRQPSAVEDFRRSFRTWRSLGCDIFLGAHGSYFDLDRKRDQPNADDSAFIDPTGCRDFLTAAERRLNAQITAEQAQGKARGQGGRP